MITVLLSLVIVIELFLNKKNTNLLAAHFVCFGLKKLGAGLLTAEMKRKV